MGALCRRWEPEQWRTPKAYFRTLARRVKRPAIYLYSYLYMEDDTREIHSLQEDNDFDDSEVPKSYRLGISVRAPSTQTTPYLDHAGIIQLLSTSCELFGVQSRFYGRIINTDRADIPLAKQWLAECTNEHGLYCESSSWNIANAYTRSRPEGIRVIDVKRMCLMPMPSESEYITLSYRWAASKRCFTTTKSNIDTLCTDTSLSHYFDLLPATIQDAIDCVRELDQRYP